MQTNPLSRTIPQTVPYLGETEVEAVLQTIQDNWITEGRQSAAFVDALKEIIGVPYGVLAPNGTMALSLGLLALGIGPGDEVLVPDITFIGSATAVLLVGATPVFVDVERHTFQLEVLSAERCITNRTRAVMPVHLYGTACDMQAIGAFARRHGLLIIEDAAQGMGVLHRGVHVGSFGDVGCFSFFADKTITTGEGGFVACHDAQIYERLCLLRNQGRVDRGSFIHPAIGFNFRMTDMQSALGLAQLRKLADIVARKQALWTLYRNGLEDLPNVRVLGPAHHSNHVPFRCVLLVERAVELQKALEEQGIQTRSFFYPLHKQPCFVAGGEQATAAPVRADADYSNSEYGFAHGVCLPLYPTLSTEDVLFIVAQIRGFYRSRGFV